MDVVHFHIVYIFGCTVIYMRDGAWPGGCYRRCSKVVSSFASSRCAVEVVGGCRLSVSLKTMSLLLLRFDADNRYERTEERRKRGGGGSGRRFEVGHFSKKKTVF